MGGSSEAPGLTSPEGVEKVIHSQPGTLLPYPVRPLCTTIPHFLVFCATFSCGKFRKRFDINV
jgi:hypothetical protein